MKGLFLLITIVVGLTSCSGPQGRVVTPEFLARYEGGGSMSTVWYQGSDDRYHYFRHLHKASKPYRIRREDMSWENELPLGSAELEKGNSLVKREFSEFIHKRELQGGSSVLSIDES